ncbi:MAG TPA: hypothetical protein VME68_06825 [Acidobacteriaceae bacterium]|nr:hypothetical protein [Acidobacteriaceae bacterium]
MPQVPGSAVRALRSAKSPLERASAALGPVAAQPPAPAPPRPAGDEPQELNVVGPRKLVRPTLPGRTQRDRRFARRDEPVLQWITGSAVSASAHESSHAEAFYFQKQMQTQTPMVFVLEDGETIEGCIEWYDRNAIKVRCTSVRMNGSRAYDTATRALIYKSSIKYLYKAGENQPQL